MPTIIIYNHLERDESGLMGSRYTRTSVPHRLVCDSEFSQVHTNHFWLHFHTTEHLSVVDTDDGPDHFGDDDHVSKVCLDTTGLFAGWSLLLGLSQTLDECHGLALESTRHTTTCSGSDEVHELIVREVQELFELNSTKGELLELALLTQFGNFLGVHLDKD